MSTNGDTVIKLSEALSELIEAYEKLQKENDEIKAKKQPT
jgi:predicted RNase H-like HicB family nuclease